MSSRLAKFANKAALALLTDIKMHLAGTDYGSFLDSSIEGSEVLTVAVIEEKVREKLLREFNYIRNHSVPPLSTFLDYITSVAGLCRVTSC